MNINKTSSRIIRNFTHLLFSNVLILILPFIYYPYLIKTIGTENYGSVIYTQSIYLLLSIIIQFGFSISATKEVSLNRNNKYRLSTIFFSIALIKLVLFLIITIISLFVLFLISINTSIDTKLHLSCLIYLIGDLFFVNWFFQGIEKMFFVSLGTLIYKLSLLACVFIFIGKSNDYILYTLIFSLCYIIGNFSLFILSIIKFKLYTFTFQKSLFLNLITDSWQFFLSRLSSVFVERFNILLLGYSNEKQYVAFYDLAIKLVGIAQLPFNLFNQAFYPNATREKNTKQVYNIIKLLSLLAIFGIILTFISAPYIISLYVGESMIQSASIINILIIGILINVPSHFVGNCLLAPFGLSKEFKNSVVYSTLLYTPIVIALYLANQLTVYTLSIAYIFYLIIILIYRVYIWKMYLKKNENQYLNL